MIRTILDNVTVNGNDYASGELLCNSPVLRKTVDENEKINLIEHPNFILTIVSNDHMYINQRVPVSFSVDNNDVTAYATVVSSLHLVGGDQYRLMYSDGMNVTEADDSSDDEPTIDPVLSESINTILGSNYDVVNDMSEEDALAAANNILYGEETPV